MNSDRFTGDQSSPRRSEVEPLVLGRSAARDEIELSSWARRGRRPQRGCERGTSLASRQQPSSNGGSMNTHLPESASTGRKYPTAHAQTTRVSQGGQVFPIKNRSGRIADGSLGRSLTRPARLPGAYQVEKPLAGKMPRRPETQCRPRLLRARSGPTASRRRQ